MVHIYQMEDATERILKSLEKIDITFENLEEILASESQFEQIFQHVKKFNELKFSYQLDSLDSRYADDKEKFFHLLKGAIGEHQVVQILHELNDNYHLINNLIVSLPKSMYWRRGNCYIRTAYIDHLLIGPPGIFICETKNWDQTTNFHYNKKAFLQLARHTYIFQRMALIFGIKNKPLIPILISVQDYIGSPPLDLNSVNLGDLIPFIKNHSQILHSSEVKEIIQLLRQPQKKYKLNDGNDIYI